MRRHVGILSLLLCQVALHSQPEQTTPPAGQVSIRVLEGEGAINIIRLKRARNPVVQVVDPSGAPVAGASVSFLLPATGPGGEFEGSGSSYTVQSDAKGIAAARGLVPNRTPGEFSIRVVASARGQTARTSVRQTNAEPVVESRRTRKYVLLGVIAGGAAVAVLAATVGGGSSSSTPGGTTGGSGISVVAGTPTIGPPQ